MKTEPIDIATLREARRAAQLAEKIIPAKRSVIRTQPEVPLYFKVLTWTLALSFLAWVTASVWGKWI